MAHLDKWDAISCALSEGLIKEDHTTDVVSHAVVSSEEQLSVFAPVIFRVGKVDVLQTFAHCA